MVAIGCNGKSACGEVEPSEVGLGFGEFNGEQELVTVCFNLVFGLSSAWGDDTGEFSLYDFSSDCGLHLFTEGDFDSLVEQFL